MHYKGHARMSGTAKFLGFMSIALVHTCNELVRSTPY